MKLYCPILSIVVLLTAFLLPGTSQAVTSYAVSDKDGMHVYGYCKDIEGFIAAQNCAMRICSKFGPGCKVFFTSRYEGYGAIAESRHYREIVAGYRTQAVANREALKDCSRHGRGCKIVDTWYDSHPFIGDWERYGDGGEPAAPVPQQDASPPPPNPADITCGNPTGCINGNTGNWVPMGGAQW